MTTERGLNTEKMKTARLTSRAKEEVVKAIMSAIQDLQAAEAAIAAAVTGATAAMNAAATLIGNLQNGSVNADDPEVEAVVTQLNNQAATLSGAASSLTTEVTPAPAPAPAPSTSTGSSTSS